MYRSVLESKDFARWSEESVVLLVTHDERQHEEKTEIDSYGNTVKRCTLYPGLSCAQHVDAAVEVDTARGEDLVKVPFVELCPNTWLVLPTGKVLPVSEEDQFLPAKIEAQVATVQKDLGAAVSLKRWADVDASATRYDEAFEAGKFHDALTHLATLAKLVPKPHASLKEFLEARVAEVDTRIGFQFDDLKADAKLPAATKRERMAALLEVANVEVLGARPPVHASIKAWLDAK